MKTELLKRRRRRQGQAEREAGEEAAAMKDKAAEKTPEAVKLIIERLV